MMGAIGLAAACRTLADRQLSQRTRLAGLRDHLDDRLRAAIPDAVRLTPAGEAALCQTLCVIFHGADGEALVEELSQRGVAVSTGSACSAGRSEPSHVLLAMGVSPERARCALRFSLGHGTSMADIERAVSAVVESVEAVRAHLSPESEE
jgi:cysteine desulfurase